MVKFPRSLALTFIASIPCLYQGQALAQFTEAAWTTHAPMPAARGQAATAVDANGRIYVIGGYENGIEVNTNYRFTPGTPGTWETLTPSPTANRGASAVYKEGKVHVFGGTAGRIQVFDVTAGTWTDEALAGLLWENASTISSDGRIFITGGEGAEQALNEFTPPATLAPLAPMLSERKEHGAAFIGTSLYVFGGVDSGYVGIAGVESYDVGTNTWSADPTDLPAPRCQFAYASSDQFVYVLGGSSNGGNYAEPIFDTTLSYNPLTNAWVAGPNLPAPSREGTAAIVGTRLYVFGGGISGAASSAVYSIGVVAAVFTNNDLTVTKPKRFETTLVGASSRSQRVSIRNVGDQPIKTLRVDVSGRARRDFLVTQPAARSLEAGESTFFQVTFHPRDEGNRKALVTVYSDSTPVSVKLQGRGQAKSGIRPPRAVN